MDLGIIFFSFALFPVLIFMYSLHNLRRCLHDANARRRAAFSTPALLMLSPLVITGFMAAEASLDPEFMARTFVNPDGKGTVDLYMFALDQTLKGTLFDAMETFNISVSSLEHKCDSVLFCTALLLYRASMGTVISIFLLTLIMRTQSWFGGRLGSSKDADAAS